MFDDWTTLEVAQLVRRLEERRVGEDDGLTYTSDLKLFAAGVETLCNRVIFTAYGEDEILAEIDRRNGVAVA